jgi:RHS repeat-associated protein
LFGAAIGADFQNVLYFGGNGADAAKSVTTDGFFLYVLGETTSTNLPNANGRNQGGGDLFVLKFDPRAQEPVWSIYVGGAGRETAGGIAVDARGNVWIGGTTASTDFPATPDAPQRTFGGGGSDAFIAQINARGTGVVYASYLGGSGAETNAQLTADRTGNYYVAGTTSGSFPTRAGSLQTTYGGGATDAFVVKLARGTTVEYATYLGGSGDDTMAAVAVDETGTAFLTGASASPNFPTSTNGYQTQNRGATDAYVARLNAGGTALLFATYIGGTGADAGTGILPSAGGAFVAVTTASRGLFTSPGAFLTSFSGGPADGYVARVSPDGSQLASATYLGGAGDDMLGPLTFGPQGEMRVIFRSNSDNWGAAFAASKKAHAAAGALPQGYYAQAQGLEQNLQDVREHVQFQIACEGRSYDLENLIVLPSGMRLIAAGTVVGPPAGGCPGAKTVGTTEGDTAAVPYNGPWPAPSKSTYSTLGMRDSSAVVGDPVSTATGELYDTFVDLDVGGPMRLAFARYYSSVLNESGMQSALGANWMHIFDQTVEVSGNTATILLFVGKRLDFTRASATAAWQLVDKVSTGYHLISDAAGLHLLSYASNNVFHFNTAGQLIKVEDRNGNALTVTPGPFGPTQVADGLGRTLTLTYSGSKLTRVADQAGRSVAFAFTGNNLTTVTGLNGRPTVYTYEPGSREGLMSSKTLPLGNRVIQFTWDSNGRVVRQTDSRNQNTSIAYGQGQTTVSNPAGAQERHVYGAGVDLTGVVDDQGKSAAIGYDDNGHRTGVTDKMGAKSAVAYHSPTGYVGSQTDTTGSTTTYTWTAQPQGSFTYYALTQIRHGSGATATYAYDARGNLLSETLRGGGERKHTYNSRGQVLTATNAAGGVTTFTYNDDGTVRSATLPSGVSATVSYNAQKQLTRITRSDGSERAYSYTPSGGRAQIVDELGRTTRLEYDANDQLIALTDALGGVWKTAFDGDGRTLTETDRIGGVTQFGYDANGRRTSVKTPSGRSQTYGYDTRDRLASVSDELGKLFEYRYNAEGVPTAALDALGRTTSFESDAMGRTTKVTGASGATVSFQYNAAGRLASVTDQFNRVSQFTYDARGMIAEAKLPGAAMQWERDALTNPVRVVDPNGNSWKTTFDNAGRMTKRTDPLDRATQYGYDARGRLSTVTLPEGSLELGYDAANRLLSKTYSDGTVYQFERDAMNRTVKANGLELGYDAEGRIVKSNSLGIERDADGRIASITYREGKTVKYTYDARGRLTGIADWAGGGATLAHNTAGELTGVTRANGVAGAYEYNADGQAVSLAEGSLSTILLKRDAAGQIVEADRNVPTPAAPPDAEQELGYDAAHQMAGAAHDAAGRLVSDGKRTYKWDLASNLLGFTEGEKTVSFSYDAFGNMISWQQGGTARAFVQNYGLGLPSIAVERRNDADATYYVHLPNGRLLYSIAAETGARRYYHYDEMGNTVFLTDDAGAVTESYGITPYGESVSAAAETENPFLFQGAMGVMRVAPGLYYMRARYYDAATARFLSPDPIQAMHPAAASPYVYAAGNPLMNVDPLGQGWNPLEAVGNFVGGVKDAAISGATNLAQGAANVATATYNAAVETGKAVYHAGEQAVEATGRFVGQAATVVAETAAGAYNATAGAVSSAAGWVAGGVSSTYNAAASGIGYVANAAGGALSAAVDAVTPDPPAPQSFSESEKKARAKAAAEAIKRMFGGGGVVGPEAASGIVAVGGANIVAVGGANIVALGGGNFSVNGVKFRLEGNNIVALGGGNIVANGGGNIIALGGANIVAMGGGNFSVNGVKVETNGGSIIAVGGANLVGLNGSNLVGLNGSNLVGLNGSNIVANGGGNVVANGGGN